MVDVCLWNTVETRGIRNAEMATSKFTLFSRAKSSPSVDVVGAR
jgi:hypothetical protein